MEGRVLFGAQRGAEPGVIFAARDRMDESSDSVRAARERRFAYTRNLQPELPYQLPNAFGAEMPTWRLMKRLHDAGELDDTQALWFREQRPPEELYDTETDPDQVRNLADDPKHADTLLRLRGALDGWLAATPDLGLLPEAELRERFWPGGEQPLTAAPAIRVAKGQVTLECETPGASLGYRIEDGAWRLYTRPFTAAGSTIEAKAVRYGWQESEPVTVQAP
jgi:hypothetical protein